VNNSQRLGRALQLIRIINQHTVKDTSGKTGINRKRITAMERGEQAVGKDMLFRYIKTYELNENQIVKLSNLSTLKPNELLGRITNDNTVITNIIWKSKNVLEWLRGDPK